jgi:hypothetical protein
VIKGLPVELYNIGAAAFMFSMTDLAFGSRDGATFSMEAFTLGDIRGNLLVASQA